MADSILLCFSAIRTALSSLLCRTSGIDKTVEQLLAEGRQLKATWDEVDRSVAAAERQQWIPRSEVKRWLARADDVIKDLDEFEARYWEWRDQQLHGFPGSLLTACGFPLLCGYAFGASAGDLLVQVRDLTGQKIDFDEVAKPPPFIAVEKIPASTLPTIGYHHTLAQIWSWLRDDSVGTVALCGLGVTAKYSLMATVNNDVNELVGTKGSYGFDVVVWVDMSRDMTEERLCRRIARRCCLLQQPHAAADDGALQLPQLLFNFLSTKRYLLLLNDLWRAFDLAEVGIPVPGPANKCKIVFATRSDYVCAEMEPQRRVLVDVLNEEDSWELFRTRVPPEILDSPAIHEHARALVAACGGLAFAVIRVGRTMANKRRPDEWEWVVRAIRESPLEIRGMGELFCQLKESYDALGGDLARRCLAHFAAAFPDRDVVDVEELLDAMIKGGLLRAEERGRGYGAVEDLKALFLLGEGGGGSNQLKLHPMVRMMALHAAKEQQDYSAQLVAH